MFTDEGDKLVIKRGGTIEITAAKKVQINGDLAVSGKIDVTGDVSSGGTVTGSADVVGGGVHLKTHLHSVSANDSVSGPVTFTPTAGKTGAPG